MPPLSIPVRRSDIKTVFQLAAEALKGAGFFPGVEAIAGVPLKLIEYYEVVKANKDEMDRLVVTLESLYQIVVEPMESARNCSHRYVPDLQKRANALTERLSFIELHLSWLVLNGRWNGFWKRDEIAGVLKDTERDVRQAIEHFQLGGQITLELEMWELAAERLLDTLHPERHARYDASEKLPCLPNTRSALLATLRNHIHNSSDTFVCLYGSPGTGKSAVAKSIATELHRDGLLAASYFFDKRGGDAGNISLATFISTLVYHLARFSFDFHAELSRQLKRDPLLADATADVRLRELLVEPLREVFSTRKPRRRWVIALDALDECGDSEHQRRLMGLLRSCAGLGEHIVFFLTCRPEVEITRVIQGWPVGPRAVIESMDEQDKAGTTEDIHAFVESKLLELKVDEGWRFSPPLDDLRRFAALCRGLFELAAVRLRELARACRSVPLRDAFPLSLHTAERADSSRSPLHAVYADVLFAAYGSPQDRSRRKARLQMHHTLVGAMTAVREPVTIRTLAALVGLEEDKARKALEPLSSVIAVPADDIVHRNRPVHFYHASFLEFLLSEPSRHRSTLLCKCLISSTQPHAMLAMQSLFLMNNMLHRNILDLPNPCVFNDTIPDLHLALERHVPAHLQYACLHWADHLRVEHSSQCQDLFVQWCEKIIFYIETLSLLGEIERVVPLFLYAEDWARKVNIQRSTVTLLYDARRLVPTFHTAITQSAGAIYSSALPFMPECLLHERYHHLAGGQVVLVDNHKRPPAWPSQIWSQAHPGWVSSVAVSPDGRYVASACVDEHVRILSASTGKVEQTLKGHRDSVYSVAFSSDGERVVSGSGDRSLCVWLSATGELEKTMKGHSQAIQSVAFSPNDLRIVSGSSDDTVRIWSAATGEQERVLEGHTDDVAAVAFFPTGLHIVSGSGDKTVRIWSGVTGVQDRILTGHRNKVQSVAVSFDGTRIASGSSDGSVRIWSAATGATEWVLEPLFQSCTWSSSMINSVDFSPDGKHLVSGLGDRTIRIWSTITGAEERVLEGHSNGVSSVAFFPDGKHIASGSDDCSVRVWSASAEHREPILDGHSLRVNSIAFSADGAHVVSASNNCSLRVWSTFTGAQEQILEGHSRAVNAASFSPDGARIVSGSDDSSVRVWSTVTGEQERVLEGHEDTVLSVAFSPDSRQIVSGSTDGSVHVWSVATGMREQVVDVHGNGVCSVAFSLDGRHIVAGEWFVRSVSVWNATTGAQEREFPVPESQGLNTVLFAANNQVVGCVGSDGHARYWDVSSGLALDGDDPRLPLQPWVKNGYNCAPDGWLTVNGHTFWVPRYFHGRWWAHPSGVLVLAPEDTPGKLVFIRLPTRT